MDNARHELNLLANALDYVLSAAEHTRRQDSRSLKYAILHLFAGIELLLKERLRCEHWALLFADVDKASLTLLDAGNFKSVEFQSLQSRLRESAAVAIPKRHLVHIEALRLLRNQAQHFAVSFTPTEVRGQLAVGMDFVIEFCKDHLAASIADSKEALDAIHNELAYFDEFVSARQRQIEPQLMNKQLWNCPRCSQHTMVLGEGDPHCPFCGYTADWTTAFFAVGGDQHFSDCPQSGCHGSCPIYDCQGGGEGALCFACGFCFSTS